MQKISTPDLSDLNPSVPFVSLQFNSYGARDFLYGPIKTVHAPNDNSFVKKILATEGQGGVLFVDGNKSFEVALLGDMIAENAYKNNASTQELQELLGRGRAKKGMFIGDLENGELEIGQVSGMLDKIMPAGEIVKEIINEFFDTQHNINQIKI